MRIKIDQWEVLRALELYFKTEYNVDCDLVEGLDTWPVIDYQEKILVKKKHKNIVKHICGITSGVYPPPTPRIDILQ